jgi:hypothetical protein
MGSNDDSFAAHFYQKIIQKVESRLSIRLFNDCIFVKY